MTVACSAHGNYFDLETKYDRLKKGAPATFVDPEGYKKYVAGQRTSLQERTRNAKSCSAGLCLKSRI
jgi:hypothetical protein